MARDGQPRGLIPRFNPELVAQAFELGERLETRMEQLAHQLEAMARTELLGEAFSRVVTAQAPAGGGLTELAVGPAPGVVWELQVVAPSVPNAAANRQANVYLGDLGDTSRPLFGTTCFAPAGAGIGGVTVLGTALHTTRPIYVRFPAPAAGETCALHVAGREFIA